MLTNQQTVNLFLKYADQFDYFILYNTFNVHKEIYVRAIVWPIKCGNLIDYKPDFVFFAGRTDAMRFSNMQLISTNSSEVSKKGVLTNENTYFLDILESYFQQKRPKQEILSILLTWKLKVLFLSILIIVQFNVARRITFTLRK